MKVGDLVKLKPPSDATLQHPMRKWPWADEVGIIIDLIEDETGIVGVVARQGRKSIEIRARAVVLACGGFESSADWRTRYLGPGWDLVKVRGTRFNTGDGIRMAMDIGAMGYGNWSGCHAVGWDRNAPEFGDLSVGDNFFGVVWIVDHADSHGWDLRLTADFCRKFNLVPFAQLKSSVS